jgi:hypothetical protein
MVFDTEKQCRHFSNGKYRNIFSQKNGRKELHEIMRGKMTLEGHVNVGVSAVEQVVALQWEDGKGGSGMKLLNSLALAITACSRHMN